MAEREREVSGRRPRPASPWARKRRRLLKWLSVLAALLLPAVLWRANLSRETRALLRAQEAAGRPVTLAQLNEGNPAIPADENGAVLYQEALALYRAAPSDKESALPFHRGAVPTPGAELSPATREATAAWLALNEGALEKVRDASARKASRYVNPYRPSGYNDISVFEGLNTLATLACAAAVYHTDRGDAVQSGVALSSALALAVSIRDEGLNVSLHRQWDMENKALDALQFAWCRIPVPEETLDAFAARISPERRRAEIVKMVTVEQCLFVARIREGYRRGIPRNILIASGVGDMNTQAYLNLMGSILEWTGAPLSQQPAIEQRFDAALRSVENRPMFFLTVHVSPPPGDWEYFRASLDHAALAQLGLAVYRFQLGQGRLPESLKELLPGISESALLFPSNGEPIQYSKDNTRATLSKARVTGQVGAASDQFVVGVLPRPSP